MGCASGSAKGSAFTACFGARNWLRVDSMAPCPATSFLVSWSRSRRHRRLRRHLRQSGGLGNGLAGEFPDQEAVRLVVPRHTRLFQGELVSGRHAVARGSGHGRGRSQLARLVVVVLMAGISVRPRCACRDGSRLPSGLRSTSPSGGPPARAAPPRTGEDETEKPVPHCAESRPTGGACVAVCPGHP